ncbi:MAG TPA: hypothetical protein VF115_12710 [Acidimicrobiia bacterium]
MADSTIRPSLDQTPPTRRGRLTAAVITILILSIASPAYATTTRLEFSGVQQTIGQGDPGRSWVSGSIEHVRGRQLFGLSIPDATTGLPTGTTDGRLNYNLDLTTFEGRVWGAVTIDYGDGGFEGTFSGSIGPANVPGGLLGEFQFVGHGFGNLEGTQVRAMVRELIAFGSATFDGVMFTPGEE